jgi:peptidoglycan/xylan/chitin deacetylase (PgdA/CDA1 family)
MPTLLKRLSYRVFTATMLPRLRAARALIGLCHHRFESTPGTDPTPGMAVTPEALARQIEVLARIGRFVSLEEVFDRDPAPGLRFWLSFDDGYRDNAEILPPILERLGVPATLFITHGFVTGEIPALEHDLATGHTPPAMSPDQLRAAATDPRLSIGCHTVSHRRLDVFNAPDWRRECAEARQWTARLTGVPVRDLAYPFGGRRDFDWRDGPGFLLQQGFRSVCSNFGGWNSPRRLDRIGSGDHTLTHLRRVPMIGSGDPLLITGWVMRMAGRGCGRWLPGK